VAFSQVWVDRLGSDAETGLPRCQVEHLRKLAVDAGHTPYFWIDSLYIPREREARKKAISLMQKVYQSASVTVILDSRIKELDDNISVEELLNVDVGIEIELSGLSTDLYNKEYGRS
jgi:hypothetical protein